MPDYKLIGHNYTPPDIVAKVTGQAKYAEDVRADGMLWCRLLGSPRPHARVTRIDTREALKIPGVRAIITADDLPPLASMRGGPPQTPTPAGTARGGQRAVAVDEHGQPIQAAAVQPAPEMKPEMALTREPVYVGEPIVAVAAIDEPTAAAAIEAIDVDYEPLPFVVDPLDSLRPGGPNARLEGNVLLPGNRFAQVKWTDADFADAAAGRLPMGAVPESDQWTYGDLSAGFKNAALVLDETFIVPTTSHICMETRSALAYWQNGKLFIHASSQGLSNHVAGVARWCGIDPSQLVFINQFTGGGFGSKSPASHYVGIPALLAKKTGQPVMMRITRDDEMAIGRARPGLVGRAKIGFGRDGRITALDLFIVSDAGPYGRGDHGTSGRLASVMYQPQAMRMRGIGVLTNGVPRGSQRGPGMQFAPVVELILTKAARQLGIDEVAIHRVNAPAGKALVGPAQEDGTRRHVTSAFVKDALDRGAELFKWEERKASSGKRHGSKVRGVGVALGSYSAGSMGFDGLMTLQPDGRLYIQSGCGNLGTLSVFDTTRAGAEAIGMPWDKVVITHGDSSKNLPWSCGQGGSQTTHAHTRANWAAGIDLKRKLQQIAAHDLGGRPEDYEVAGERVFRKGSPGRGLTFAQAAGRAIELGDEYDGHRLPPNIHPMTKAAGEALAGRGVMGVAKDAFGRDGDTMSFVAGFAEVEVDVETGELRVVDYTAVADCGTVLHPRNCQGQAYGGSMLGISHAIGLHWVFDRQWGAPLARRFYQSKPPSMLDAPPFQFAAVDLPDPDTPVGARGIGEPPVGAAFGAVVNALVAAVGEEAFRRSPVRADVILAALEAGGRRAHDPLASNI